jgi:hypothetical protein
MSYDFNIRLAPCDHQQSFERYVIDWEDFMTLHVASNVVMNMRAPINGVNQVEVYIGGQLIQPNDLTYGYKITPDINRVQTDNPNQFYKIMFNKPIRWYVPLIEVSYITVKNFCLKCGTAGQLNDIKPASNGSVIHTVGTDKMVQRVLKMVLTSQCGFYPQFTCPIKSYVGKRFGVTITDADVSNQVMTALQNLKSIQSAQRTVQHLDPQEMLKDIQNLQTTTVDPTSISIAADLTSYGTPNATSVSFALTTSSQLVGQ